MFAVRVEQVRVATPAGADALPDFFKLIRIDTHLGVSPSAQASPTEQDGGVDTDLPAQLRAISPLQTRKAVLAADETFRGAFDPGTDEFVLKLLAAGIQPGWGGPVNEETRQWLTGKLLPVVYWHHPLHKTKNPGQRKRYREAWQRAVKDFNTDPIRSDLTEK
jgi:hypothetical protein